MSATLVSVKGLRVEHRMADLVSARKLLAVEDVSFGIVRGDTLALVGESGCGKTTTARALLRLIDVSAGAIEYDGIDLLALKGEPLRRHRKRMQIVFQDPYTSLNPRHTVAAIVGEGLIVHALAKGAEITTRVTALLEEVGLTPSDLPRYPHELSGGQRQRVAIARALAVNPEFVVLDEAVSALDMTTQAQVLRLLIELQRESQTAVLFITHDLGVVAETCDRALVMQRGRIVESATVDALFHAPEHAYTKELLAAMPRLDQTGRTA